MQQNAKHSRPNVLPQPEWSGHNVLIPSVDRRPHTLLMHTNQTTPDQVSVRWLH